MSKEANSFLIGLFVIGAVFLFAGGLILFGSGDYFEKKFQAVAFFDGSVKGLRVGAAVNFRGVTIGQVDDIQVRMDINDKSILIPVFMTIRPDKVIQLDGQKRPLTGNGEMLDRMIDKGLRARLDLESFVTGILNVDLNYYEDAELRLQGVLPKYIEIPTIPSQFEKLSNMLDQLELDELVTDIRGVIQKVDEFLSSEQNGEIAVKLTTALDELTKTLGSARGFIENVDGSVKPVVKDLRATLQETEAAAKSANETFEATSDLLSEESEGRYELRELIRNLRGASIKIKNFTDYLERNPDALIRGKR